VNEVGQSASAGPARAACDMMRCIITGETEVQPVIAIIEKEYGLLGKKDGLESMSFGVPARIGPYGVEKIYELPVMVSGMSLTDPPPSSKRTSKRQRKSLMKNPRSDDFSSLFP